jgi:preprotein translocase SecE subunit
MAFGIYKPGQGYWVRVLTAAFAGVLLLFGAQWLWGQLERAGRFIPHPTSVITTTHAPQYPAGTQLTLLGRASAEGQAPSLGTATVVGPAEGGGLTIKDIKYNAGVEATTGIEAISDAAGAPVLVRGQPRPIPAFEPLYLQAAGVGLFLLLGAIVIYYFVAVTPRAVEFLIATDGEMKKVNWSTRRDVINSTLVVILWAVLIAGGLFIVDAAFASFFRLIGVLQA